MAFSRTGNCTSLFDHSRFSTSIGKNKSSISGINRLGCTYSREQLQDSSIVGMALTHEDLWWISCLNMISDAYS